MYRSWHSRQSWRSLLFFGTILIALLSCRCCLMWMTEYTYFRYLMIAAWWCFQFSDAEDAGADVLSRSILPPFIPTSKASMFDDEDAVWIFLDIRWRLHVLFSALFEMHDDDDNHFDIALPVTRSILVIHPYLRNHSSCMFAVRVTNVICSSFLMRIRWWFVSFSAVRSFSFVVSEMMIILESLSELLMCCVRRQPVCPCWMTMTVRRMSPYVHACVYHRMHDNLVRMMFELMLKGITYFSKEFCYSLIFQFFFVVACRLIRHDDAQCCMTPSFVAHIDCHSRFRHAGRFPMCFRSHARPGGLVNVIGEHDAAEGAAVATRRCCFLIVTRALSRLAGGTSSSVASIARHVSSRYKVRLGLCVLTCSNPNHWCMTPSFLICSHDDDDDNVSVFPCSAYNAMMMMI